MLDNTDNQRLHDRIAQAAALTPAPLPILAPSSQLDCPPFEEDKMQRILDRVYDRLAEEVALIGDPQLRAQIAMVAEHLDAESRPLPAAKVARILDRVQARLATESAQTDVEPALKLPVRAALHSTITAASCLVRRLFVSARPLPDGPTERS
jgi:hypothetical protein